LDSYWLTEYSIVLADKTDVFFCSELLTKAYCEDGRASTMLPFFLKPNIALYPELD
jgi:hypothetical protein